MKTESQIKTKMIKEIKDAGGYARRIEDQYAVGILDTIIIWPKLPVLFCEVKKVEHDKYAPSPRQYIEGERIISAQEKGTRFFGYPFLVGVKNGIFHSPVVWFEEARCSDFGIKSDSITGLLEEYEKWLTLASRHMLLMQLKESLRRSGGISTETPKTHSE